MLLLQSFLQEEAKLTYVREVNLFSETQLHKYMQCIFQRYVFLQISSFNSFTLIEIFNDYVRSINNLFIEPYIRNNFITLWITGHGKKQIWFSICLHQNHCIYKIVMHGSGTPSKTRRQNKYFANFTYSICWRCEGFNEKDCFVVMKNWWFIGLRRYPAPCEMLPVRLTRLEREYSESGASLAAARHSFIVAETEGRGNLHVSRCLCLVRMLVYIEGEIFTISNNNIAIISYMILN